MGLPLLFNMVSPLKMSGLDERKRRDFFDQPRSDHRKVPLPPRIHMNDTSLRCPLVIAIQGLNIDCQF